MGSILKVSLNEAVGVSLIKSALEVSLSSIPENISFPVCSKQILVLKQALVLQRYLDF